MRLLSGRLQLSWSLKRSFKWPYGLFLSCLRPPVPKVVSSFGENGLKMSLKMGTTLCLCGLSGAFLDATIGVKSCSEWSKSTRHTPLIKLLCMLFKENPIGHDKKCYHFLGLCNKMCSAAHAAAVFTAFCMSRNLHCIYLRNLHHFL